MTARLRIGVGCAGMEAIWSRCCSDRDMRCFPFDLLLCSEEPNSRGVLYTFVHTIQRNLVAFHLFQQSKKLIECAGKTVCIGHDDTSDELSTVSAPHQTQVFSFLVGGP